MRLSSHPVNGNRENPSTGELSWFIEVTIPDLILLGD
jgi:hypothetical protein